MWECKNIPLAEYYDEISAGARSLGFQQMVTLLAREADAPWIFKDLKKDWISLNDISSERVLFCLAGDIRGEGSIRDEIESANLPPGETIKYSESLAILPIQKLKDKKWWEFKIDKLRNHTKNRPSSNLANHHTSEISKLLRHLNVPEKNVPCLHINDFESGINLTVPAFTGVSLYGILKAVMVIDQELDDRKILTKLRAELEALQQIGAGGSYEFIEPLLKAELFYCQIFGDENISKFERAVNDALSMPKAAGKSAIFRFIKDARDVAGDHAKFREFRAEAQRAADYIAEGYLEKIKHLAYSEIREIYKDKRAVDLNINFVKEEMRRTKASLKQNRLKVISAMPVLVGVEIAKKNASNQVNNEVKRLIKAFKAHDDLSDIVNSVEIFLGTDGESVSSSSFSVTQFISDLISGTISGTISGIASNKL